MLLGFLMKLVSHSAVCSESEPTCDRSGARFAPEPLMLWHLAQLAVKMAAPSPLDAAVPPPCPPDAEGLLHANCAASGSSRVKPNTPLFNRLHRRIILSSPASHSTNWKRSNIQETLYPYERPRRVKRAGKGARFAGVGERKHDESPPLAGGVRGGVLQFSKEHAVDSSTDLSSRIMILLPGSSCEGRGWTPICFIGIATHLSRLLPVGRAEKYDQYDNYDCYGPPESHGQCAKPGVPALPVLPALHRSTVTVHVHWL